MGLGGFDEWQTETDYSILTRLERWTLERMVWGAQGKDIPKLRAYYLARTYREAAEPMAKFHSLVMGLTESKLRFASPMEFEDDQIVYRNAMRTKADGLFAGTVADELEKCVCAAEEQVKNPFAAKAVREFREAWDKYKAEAIATEAKWQEDLKGGAASKAMKVVGAPE